MKGYRNTIAAVLCASGLAFAMGAQAQPGPGPEGMRGQGPMGMHGEGRHGGRQGGPMAGLRSLGLSEAQQDQIFKIHHEQAPAFRDGMKKVRASREELQKLARADKLDPAAVRRAADAQAKAISDLAVLRVTTGNRVRQVLTPEQRTQLDHMRDQRRRGPGPKPAPQRG